ncbi:uncharacterized protein LOC126399182 [Epinephelus moara]|uniref:uncharacterized protein LOC126399182 n=1 Tax=Epinephelus moara TaxID=300413 RepID=UPI00214EFE66|nr:uncharacterized protein LOC126399182 [Epinephelus moara]
MMAEFRWIIMSLFLMLLFKFTAAATEKYSLVGDEVTLSCENVTHDQDNCDSATWLFSDRRNTVTLFEHGKIHREAEAKSDRLSVTAKCSLVIKKVTREDVGRYSCRQFRSGRQVSDSQVDVSVVTMTEHKDTDRVILFCSVWTYEQCPHTVKWLYEGNQNDLETSQSTCSASVTFTTSDYNQKLKYSELLKCEVTDGHTKEVHQFTFSPPQSSGEKPGHDAATAASTTTRTTTTTDSPSTTGSNWTSMKRSTSEATNNRACENNNNQTTQGPWWFMSVGLAALIISVVTVNIWTRTKGNKTQMDENMNLLCSTGTNDEVLRLIDLRVANDNLFTGKRYTSKKAWIEITQLLDMGDRVTPIQVSKKWDNLKIQYKARGQTGGEETAATWPFYAQMHEAIGARPSIEQHVLMDSCNPVDEPVAQEEAELQGSNPGLPGGGGCQGGRGQTRGERGQEKGS